jgi:hypothetical protein
MLINVDTYRSRIHTNTIETFLVVTLKFRMRFQDIQSKGSLRLIGKIA